MTNPLRVSLSGAGTLLKVHAPNFSWIKGPDSEFIQIDKGSYLTVVGRPFTQAPFNYYPVLIGGGLVGLMLEPGHDFFFNNKFIEVTQ